MNKSSDKINPENSENRIYEDDDSGHRYPRPPRNEDSFAKRGRQEQDPSMKNIDLEVEIANLSDTIRELFAKEIDIAKKNFDKRFQTFTAENPSPSPPGPEKRSTMAIGFDISSPCCRVRLAGFAAAARRAPASAWRDIRG